MRIASRSQSAEGWEKTIALRAWTRPTLDLPRPHHRERPGRPNHAAPGQLRRVDQPLVGFEVRGDQCDQPQIALPGVVAGRVVKQDQASGGDILAVARAEAPLP